MALSRVPSRSYPVSGATKIETGCLHPQPISLLFPQVYVRPVWASYRELMRRTQADAIFMVGPGWLRRREGQSGEGAKRGEGQSGGQRSSWWVQASAPPPNILRRG